MYDFQFYFFYGILVRRNDDPIFTSILGVFVIVGLHLLTIIRLLDYFGIVSYPSFNSAYLYNKLFWYIPGAVILGGVYIYFGKVKTKSIIDRYSAKDNFFTFQHILFFLLQILIPIIVIAVLNKKN